MSRTTGKIHPLLMRISRIGRMERGTVCRMKGRPHFNHQTWQDGRNVVRYVPPGEVEELQEAIDGYRLFQELVRQYADLVIARTRRARKPTSRKRTQKAP